MDLRLATIVVRLAAQFSAPTPLAETILARLALSAAGLSLPDGPMTIGPVFPSDRLMLHRQESTWVVTGELRRIPWARFTKHIVALAHHGAETRTVLIQTPAIMKLGRNYANEPRDDIQVSNLDLSEAAVGAADVGWSLDTIQELGALFRAAAMAGALEQIQDLTLRHATERIQFGRPIGKFQAVQQQISVLATHVAAADAAVNGALTANKSAPASFEIAAAKMRTGEAAGIASEIAHQVHAAMGFTLEHSLQRSTRRLWSWRDEFGSESDWAIKIGKIACELGGEGLWQFLTAFRHEDTTEPH
ncbi:MAG: hypothetical protein JKY94_00100 [Rhodobacteraceae bacterium]|nr:hypothetical protein [Paracoccaceae bacterium]